MPGPGTVPWAPPEGRLQDAYRIADMIRDTGMIQAQGQYNKRMAVSDLISGVSGSAIGMVEANQEKKKQAEIASILQSGEGFDPYALVKKYGVESTKKAYDLYTSMRPKDQDHVLNQGDVLVRNGKIIARGDPKEEPAGSMQWAFSPTDTEARLYPNREISEKGYRRADTAEMRNKAVATAGATTAVTNLKGMSDRLITSKGLAQRAGAIKGSVEAWFGENDEYRAYLDLRKGAAMMLATEQQQRPSDSDVEGWLRMVPDPVRDTEGSAKIKWQYINDMRAKGITPAEVSGATKSGEPTVKMTDPDGGALDVPLGRVAEAESKGAKRAAPIAPVAPPAAGVPPPAGPPINMLPPPPGRPQAVAPPPFAGAPGFTPPSMTGLSAAPPAAPPAAVPVRPPAAPPTATANPLKGAPAPAASGARVAMLDPGGNPIAVAQSQVAWAVANGARVAPVAPPAAVAPPGVVRPNPAATTPVDPRSTTVRREEARAPLAPGAMDRPSGVMVRMIDNDGQPRLVPPQDVAAAEALDWRRADAPPPAAAPPTAGRLIGPPVPPGLRAGVPPPAPPPAARPQVAPGVVALDPTRGERMVDAVPEGHILMRGADGQERAVPLPPGYVLVRYPLPNGKGLKTGEFPVKAEDLPAARKRGAVVVWPREAGSE